MGLIQEETDGGAALDMTTPHPQSLSPLRGEGSQWRRGQLDWRRWQRCNLL